jgi:flavin reductase (DIM6/NTAB) family NADH-FMN oxidoreductase RutF/DNA-binding IclR family transcriptional regulator
MSTIDMAASAPPAITPGWFRQVLGQYPTGVCVITAAIGDGEPVGMVVGSFTSVSLNPPLVAFLPDRNSSTWAQLRTADHFCVNILGAEQEAVCRRFATKAAGRSKFDGLPQRRAPSGAPIIADVVAWIDCQRHSLHEAGDHDIVIGEVKNLQIEAGGLPLLFFQGGYGRFLPLSLAAHDPLGTLTDQLHDVDVARPFMEKLADEFSARCIATAQVDDKVVVVASAGRSARGSVVTLVGQQFPFIPPTSSVFAAWHDERTRAAWIAANAPAARAEGFAQALERVRERGFSVGLSSEAQREFAQAVNRLAQDRGAAKTADLRELIQGLSFDPPTLDDEVSRAVRLVSVPVRFHSDVSLALTLYDFPRAANAAALSQIVDHMRAVADEIGSHLMGKDVRP